MSSATSTALLDVQSFHKAYEGVVAVEDLSFQVQAGEILGVIGPNGAGKTTTMRALSALIAPTSGTMHVAGYHVESSPVQVKRSLAYVPDDPRLFPHLTVDEHLAFAASAYHVEDADTKAARLLEMFELDGKRRVAVKDLSRGMRQKLAICCSYIYDPVALLFDEPLTGLDPMGIRMLKRSIVDRAAQGAAVMVSSHLLAMVEDICTHILLLSKGKQQFFGTVAELKAQFSEHGDESTLEQIFFMATDENAGDKPRSSHAESVTTA